MQTCELLELSEELDPVIPLELRQTKLLSQTTPTRMSHMLLFESMYLIKTHFATVIEVHLFTT